MHEHWLKSSDDINNYELGNYAMCKIYLSPHAAKKKKTHDEEIDDLVQFVEAALDVSFYLLLLSKVRGLIVFI
ncbi:hypothetical protein AXX17_AT3G29730 [Arabidopsis thaliana]|uniref:Uncharacterized protein n=1 Tax=Arabidopsis thaliana TaxID=3702 RepID=A0A178VFV4_ARATH|nr:hypothetical protein AXX17_AT3G29730 [Arabidopsis thaliana]